MLHPQAARMPPGRFTLSRMHAHLAAEEADVFGRFHDCYVSSQLPDFIPHEQ